MNATPTRKQSGDLTHLTRVAAKDLKVGKVYYIRIRNKDTAADVWGIKEDFIGKINMIDATGVSFDYTYKRNADPRHGASVWKKADEYNRVLVFAESLKHKDMNDNTTFYVDNKPAGAGTRKRGRGRVSKTRKAGRR